MEEEDDAFAAAQGLARSNRQRPQRTNPLSERELEEMLVEGYTASAVMLRIARDNCLQRLMLDVEVHQRKLHLIVKVLGKALGDPNSAQPEARNNVIFIFRDAKPFHDKIWDSLQGRLARDEHYINAILILLKNTAQAYPNVAAKTFSHIFVLLEFVIDETFPQHEKLNEEKGIIKRLLYEPVRAARQEEEENRGRAIRERHLDYDVDPNLFRELSVVPTAADFNPAEDIKVRCNKLQGGYDNVNDYLDIQFRLLRADLIMPLRDSILKYLDAGEQRDIPGLRVYSHVRIVRPVCHDKGLCFRLSFDVHRVRRVNWQVSQRLKYGSLLCLSTDNFNTYIFAVVENREPKDLAKGLVDVQFIFTDNGPEMQVGGHERFMELLNEARDQRFIMVESPTYFEAYKHVLRGLQAFTENNFPFWRYIGQCNRNVDRPQYLQDVDRQRYDLRPLVDTEFVIKDDRNENHEFNRAAAVAAEVDIFDPDSWPNANTLSLDSSQFQALQSALTKEFSIIQGPPGTGKTFIGLMVMKALLHNKQAWIGDGQATPILLVCYTNHALDQFLEGILTFFQGSLVRVGSRSKSERLEEYNLRGLRSRARENRTVPIEVHLAKQDERIHMKDLKADLHKEAAKLEILEREIVKESFLKCVMHSTHYGKLTERSGKESVIARWLGVTLDTDKLKREAQKRGGRQGNHQQRGAGAARPGADDGVPAAAHADAHGGNNGNETGDEEQGEEDEEDDVDLLDIVNQDLPQTRHLDVDDDDDVEDDDGLFAELLAGQAEDYIEAVRNVNRKLDDTDIEVIKVRKENIAFNISEYGEEPRPPNLSKEEKEHWQSMIPMKKRYRAILLQYMQQVDRMTEDEVRQVYNVWRLKKSDKWRLYRYWVDLYCRQIRGEIRDKARQYEQSARRYQEILHQEDKGILEKATIVGMTTTGAARYQAILREIGPKIVLVEEAAEVLEGHVITSLSDQCQHVVLIGDHKQLRPNPSVYKLKKDFGLDISLFERLVENNFQYVTLRYQHRMRPEISRLLRVPDLYPDLQDHDMVKTYPNVERVRGNICFIQHSKPEEAEEETKTFSNPYEARFIIRLCEYILQQGQFRPEQITILSPYAGQIHYIKSNFESLAKSHATVRRMKGVKISSVDNYQGEENDIILLSLVRSNEDNEIGFLKANNRICVALSRAKIGLYVVGDFVGLAKSSPLIQEISCEARRLGYLNSTIVLTCTRHRRAETVIREPKDFDNVAEGGCSQPCGMRLNCGHSCKRVCHADDLQHTNAQCLEECKHLCEKCEQNCSGEHQCGQHKHCTNLIEKRITNCGHKQAVPCYMEPNMFICKERCREPLPCGHQCSSQCGSKHSHDASVCKVKVQVTPKACGHGAFELECGKIKEDVDFECTEPCGAVLECEHLCGGTCGQCKGGRLHVDCQQKCQKILICGHPCRDRCNSCSPCSHPCETACRHSRCPKKCGEQCQPCVEPCSWNCRHEQCQDLCCQPCERPPCDIQCPERLPCGHVCCGLCGEKCPKLCSTCDQEKLKCDSLYGYDGDPTTQFVELDCGHVLEVDFVDQWMRTSNATSEGSDQQEIGLKTCPKCKIPIRKCDRYNGQIKKMLIMIESVKRKYIGENRAQRQRHLEDAVSDIRGQDRQLVDAFLTQEDQVLSDTILVAQINQVRLYRKIAALRRVTLECQNRWQQRAATFKTILQDLDHFSDWTLRKRTTFSEQNKLDAELEKDRLSVLIDLHKLELEVTSRNLREKIPARHMTMLGQNIGMLSQYKRADKVKLEECKNLCEEMRKLVPESHIALTSQEKMEIVRAVNVSRGAWYKCPNGHIYAIGECGQAMEESKCPECNAAIGGTGHQLRSDNAWASEMDNAEEPVWNNLDADRQLAEMLQRELNEGNQDFFL